MAVVVAKKLWEDALKGVKLSTKDRRHVIAWLMATDSQSISDMALAFKVSERTISLDKVYIREQVAKDIQAEDIGMVFADIRMAFEKNMRDIETSKQKASLGTKTYLDHCNASFKLQMDFVRGMQDLGVYPKELGTLHVDKFEFTATVGLDAVAAGQRPVTMFDDKKPKVIAAQIVDPKSLTDGKSPAEAEYVSTVEDSQSNNGQASKPDPPASA
jgi:hypothetical protein